MSLDKVLETIGAILHPERRKAVRRHGAAAWRQARQVAHP